MIRDALAALALGGLAVGGLAACVSTPAAAPPQAASEAAEGEIIALLTAQQAAWNDGDIDGFMQGYWQSPELRFGSGGSVTRGWQETLDRYRQGYPDRGRMGELRFSELDPVVFSEDAAVLHGRWQLIREGDAPSGLFTLVLRRVPEGWRIISDTTTSAG